TSAYFLININSFSVHSRRNSLQLSGMRLMNMTSWQCFWMMSTNGGDAIDRRRAIVNSVDSKSCFILARSPSLQVDASSEQSLMVNEVESDGMDTCVDWLCSVRLESIVVLSALGCICWESTEPSEAVSCITVLKYASVS